MKSVNINYIKSIDNYLSKVAPSGARTHGLRITTGPANRQSDQNCL